MNNLLIKLRQRLVASFRKHFIFNHTLNRATFMKLKNEHDQNTEKRSIYLNKTPCAHFFGRNLILNDLTTFDEQVKQMKSQNTVGRNQTLVQRMTPHFVIV